MSDLYLTLLGVRYVMKRLLYEKQKRLILFSIGLLIFSFFISMISLSSGVYHIDLEDVFSVLFLNSQQDSLNHSIILDISLPRIILSFCVGIALAVSGAVMQGLFRNPLADPAILGVSAGAALGAVIPISLTIHSIHVLIVPIFSFTGGLIASGFVYLIYLATGKKSSAVLLLSGIAIGTFLNSLITLTVYLSGNPFQMQAIFMWLIGGFEATRWDHVFTCLPVVILSTVFLTIKSKDINPIMISDEYAASLGINVKRTFLICLIFATLATSVAVSVSGILAFVGLVIPHVVRLFLGSDNRLVIPVSALTGGFFILSMDYLARIFFSSTDFRVGVLMSLIGGPFFIFLIFKNNFNLRRRNEI